MKTASSFTARGYSRFLLFIAGMGVLLYGIDVGIISAALLYLGETVSLSIEQTSMIIEQAFCGPLPGERSGWLVAMCLALFIASFSVGPGVVVWLTLSELMPTRIRSGGMGIALLFNQGVSTAIAGGFLPVVGRYGYTAMFVFRAGCSVIYFLTATLFLPETKGKTLEEIELDFASKTPSSLWMNESPSLLCK